MGIRTVLLVDLEISYELSAGPGSLIVKADPTPGSLLTSTVPPLKLIMRLTRGRPRPLPSAERAGSPW
ncbi:hypothetical protein D3C73_1584620 [compost metagenome]